MTETMASTQNWRHMQGSLRGDRDDGLHTANAGIPVLLSLVQLLRTRFDERSSQAVPVTLVAGSAPLRAGLGAASGGGQGSPFSLAAASSRSALSRSRCRCSRRCCRVSFAAAASAACDGTNRLTESRRNTSSTEACIAVAGWLWHVKCPTLAGPVHCNAGC